AFTAFTRRWKLSLRPSRQWRSATAAIRTLPEVVTEILHLHDACVLKTPVVEVDAVLRPREERATAEPHRSGLVLLLARPEEQRLPNPVGHAVPVAGIAEAVEHQMREEH